MRLSARPQPEGTTPEGFAPIDLVSEVGERLCQIDLQYSRLARLPRANPRAIDFLLIAATAYAIDKLVMRATAPDAWTRRLSLSVPVSDVSTWNGVRHALEACVSFLTGDSWSIRFTSLASVLVRPAPRRRRTRRHNLVAAPTGDAVCLFSGGLDSLVGAIDWLESQGDRRLLLVGHHDGQMGGPYGDQKALLGKLRPAYAGRVASIFVRVGHKDESVEETEITLRSRSLLFVALGIFAASSLSDSVPLLIPENGVIALNVPLTPSRRGSCSTRTAHPQYLGALGRILADVGLANPMANPLEGKTKGEVIEECLNRALLRDTAPMSVSCAKRGHRRHWTHRDAKSCGRCMPCIYRRAALHKLGWDSELYGDDVCRGEGDLHGVGGKSGSDVRACLSFLNSKPSVAKVASLLIASGSLPAERLVADARLVLRAFDEIRTLLAEKAIAEVKSLAGL